MLNQKKITKQVSHRFLPMRIPLIATALFFLAVCRLDASSGMPDAVSHALIQLSEDCTERELRASLQNAGLQVSLSTIQIREIVPSLRIYKLTGTDAQIDALEQHSASYSCILYYEKEQLIEWRDTEPNDPRFSDQFQLARIGLTRVWDQTTGGTTVDGKRICVAVIESGIEIDHPDLADNLWTNRGEVPGDGIDNDGNGYVDDFYGLNVRTGDDQHPVDFHGVGVSGIIGAVGDNGEGVSGVNWDVELMMLTRARTSIDIVEAYQYILEQRQLYDSTDGAEGAYVVATNFSAGISDVFGTDFPIWCGMYDLLGDAGILSIGATTNDEDNVDETGDMPSTCDSEYLIIVSNSDELDRPDPTGSGFGIENVDMVAPGLNILTTTRDAGYQEAFSGTSAAAPHVAGAVALLHSIPCEELIDDVNADPAAGALRIKAAMYDGVLQLDDFTDRVATGGRLDVHAAFLRLGAACDIVEQQLLLTVHGTTSDQIRILYSTLTDDDHDLTIWDPQGRAIHQERVRASVALLSEVRIDQAGSWPAGAYTATLSNDVETVTARFGRL